MSECEIWHGAANRNYPVKMYGRRLKYIARYLVSKHRKLDYDDKSWKTLHKCNNSRCIRLSHLLVGTNSEVQLHSVEVGTHNEARKTHCPRKHKYIPENMFIRNNSRVCKQCARIRDRARGRARNKSA